MGKLLAVIKREYLERVRTRWFLIATLFGPILMGAIMIIPAVLMGKSFANVSVSNTLIIDASGSGFGRKIAAAVLGPLADSSAMPVLAVDPARVRQVEDSATRAVMRDSLRGYLVVDRTTIDAGTAHYAGRNASSLPDMQRIERGLQAAVVAHRLEREGLNPARVQAISNVKASVSAERITDKGKGGSGELTTIFAFVVAFMLYMLIVLYGQTILRGVMEEKTTRVAEVVVAAVPADTLLAGKVLGVGAVGLTQLALWALTSAAVIRAREPIMHRLGVSQSIPFELPDIGPTTWLVLVLCFALGFTLYASLFAAVGSMVSSDQDAQQAATPVMLLVVFSAIFIQPVVINPTSTVSRIVSWIPFSAPIIMPVRLSLITLPWYEITGVLVGMAIACSIAVWLAARIYRVGLLMYGKRPTLAELVRWVKYA